MATSGPTCWTILQEMFNFIDTLSLYRNTRILYNKAISFTIKGLKTTANSTAPRIQTSFACCINVEG